MNRTLTTVALLVSLALPVTAATTYGPTHDQETLWSIAARLRPTQNTSIQQVALALYRKNPQSFESANINALKHNVILQTPTLAEIRATSYVQAVRATQQHNAAWQNGGNTDTRSTVVAKVTTSRPAEVAKPRTIVKVVEKPVVVVNNTVRRQQEAEIKQLKQQVTVLNRELASAKSQTTRLRQQLALAKQTNTTTDQATETKVAAANPAPIQQASARPSQSEIEIARKVQKLTAQVADLESVLEEKNNHINNLNATLKNASDTIKRQYAENRELADKLNSKTTGQAPALNAANLATAQDPAQKPELKLAGVSVPTAPAQSQGNNESSASADAATSAAEVNPEASVSSTSKVEGEDNTALAESNTSESVTSTPTPSVEGEDNTASAVPNVPESVTTSASSVEGEASEASVVPSASENVTSTPTATPSADSEANTAAVPAATAKAGQEGWTEEPTTNRSNATLQPTNDVKTTQDSNSVAKSLLDTSTPAATPLFGKDGKIPPPSTISYIIGTATLGFIGLLWWRSRRDKKLRANDFPIPEQERRRKTLRQDPIIPFEPKQRDKTKAE